MKLNEMKIIEIQNKYPNINIVAATKYVKDVELLKELYDMGIDNFGENRANSFLEKYDALTNYKINWHFIGHLQKNKVKDVINKIDCLHSLDSISLATAIEKVRIKPLNCFVEVNMSKEESKTGLSLVLVDDFFSHIKEYSKINVIGLMTMASKYQTEEEIKQVFASLCDLMHELNQKYSLNMTELSMGMSNDYEMAIEQGATYVRLGRILFDED